MENLKKNSGKLDKETSCLSRSGGPYLCFTIFCYSQFRQVARAPAFLLVQRGSVNHMSPHCQVNPFLKPVDSKASFPLRKAVSAVLCSSQKYQKKVLTTLPLLHADLCTQQPDCHFCFFLLRLLLGGFKCSLQELFFFFLSQLKRC